MFHQTRSVVRIGIGFMALTLVIGILALSAAPTFAYGGRPLSATLLGANEVSSGDPDGSGHAAITLNQGQGEVCFDIAVADVVPIAAAHIHAASAGVNGPVVVNFNVPVNGLSGCVGNVDAELIKAIRQDPSAYYVNVHNAIYPGGALRGQLSK